MSFREFLKSLAATYFVIVTLIVLATYILGMMFRPDAVLTYEAFLSPLIYGLLGVIPAFLMYSKKELTVGQLLWRKALQLVCIEAVLVFFGFGARVLSRDNLSLVLSFMLSVFVIFVLAHVIMFVLDKEQARQLNKALGEFQSRQDTAE